jgi:hypothetical protein
VGQSLVSSSGAFSSFSNSFSAFLASSNARLVLLRSFSRRLSSVSHIHAVVRAFLNLKNASPTGVARKSSRACWYRVTNSLLVGCYNNEKLNARCLERVAGCSSGDI